jgi:hypothetical protein
MSRAYKNFANRQASTRFKKKPKEICDEAAEAA